MVHTAAQSIHYQGALDQLCGPYAIINALKLCGVKPCRKVFRACLTGLSSRRWPEAVWDGTTFGDLQRMLRPLNRLLKRHLITVRYPMARRVPRSKRVPAFLIIG